MNRRAIQTSQEGKVLPAATAMRARLNHSYWKQHASCTKAADKEAHLQRISDEQEQQRDR